MFKKIGIALAAFEPHPDYFLKQLESIETQSYQDWKCWIGFDSSLAVIRGDSRFGRFFQDPRFHWNENSNRLGHLKNFEAGIQRLIMLGVNSIACCDQDDVWYPTKLEVSLEALQKAGALGLVFCDMHLMDGAGKVSPETAWQIEKRGVGHCSTFDFLIRNVVPGTGMLMDAELARRFPEVPLEAGFHDRWYPLVASRFGKVMPIRRPLYAYRIHGENVVGVTPYRGLLAQGESQKAGLAGVFAKCASVWEDSNRLALATQKRGVGLSFFEKLAFVWGWDFGLILALFGAFRVVNDPALARASWARALGKCLLKLRVAKPASH